MEPKYNILLMVDPGNRAKPSTRRLDVIALVFGRIDS